jgi:Fe-S-cluster containining protein
MSKIHPCLSCGACCTHLRVSFHWSEILPESYAVPEIFTEVVSNHMLCMKGTNVETEKSRCECLSGVIGDQVSCQIYENRSSTCRDFVASYENGEVNPFCDFLRSEYGLPPLTEKDF